MFEFRSAIITVVLLFCLELVGILAGNKGWGNPQKVDNLLVGGRCISATHVAMRSPRVMSTCMATGEAIGTAASLCLKENITPRELNVKLLQKTLLQQRAYLGDKYE